MKNKVSRRIIGTFAEIGLLVRSFTQLIFDNIKNVQDPYYLWLLEIRDFLRFILMPKLRNSQVIFQQNETIKK